MKVKTSITLSEDVIKRIDRHRAGFRGRSDFIEAAAKDYMARRERAKTEQRDLEIMDSRAAALNREAEDALDFQVPL